MTKEAQIKRIAVVEDDDVVYESLSDMLTYDNAYQVVRRAETVEEAMELFSEMSTEDLADLVLVDIGLSDGKLPTDYVLSLPGNLPFTHVAVSSAGDAERFKGAPISIINKTNLNNIRDYIPRLETGEVFQEP